MSLCNIENTLPRSCHVPGTSKHLNMFQLSSNPKIFCFDTPGIMTPKYLHIYLEVTIWN